jgi:hypothetical protein
MCVGCFVVSAFTMFMPVTEAPTAPGYTALDAPVVSQTQTVATVEQAEQLELQQLRQALGEMVAAFPPTPDSQLLRAEFGSLHQQLQATDDLAIANQILDDGFMAIRDKILAAPNSDHLIEMMYEMREARFEQMQAFAPLIPGLKTGWLS